MTETTSGHPPVMPFGKYKGSCAGCVARHDPRYCQWALAQDGLPERYPDVCQWWESAGIRPLQYCTAPTTTGHPCPWTAKHGMLCGNHYRQAEKALMVTVDTILREAAIMDSGT